MKIVADIGIPFLKEAVRTGWPEVELRQFSPDEIDRLAVRDADVLVVRTRTRVDSDLLEGSRVRLVCTATIGYDHVDTEWCEAHGIAWTACPGCNAQAVCDYIEEVLNDIYRPISECPEAPNDQRPTIGIVGVGHVGSLVAWMAERRGLHVLLNDPPRGIGVSLDEIAQNSDIITFHVPLSDDTHYLCNADFLRRCKPGALIINAARGGVVDEEALLRSGHPYVLDTWEGEPHISAEVLAGARLASMHIAGYSLQGKRNATQMCLAAIAERFGLPEIAIPAAAMTDTQGDTSPGWLRRITERLKAAPDQFEPLRRTYPLR